MTDADELIALLQDATARAEAAEAREAKLRAALITEKRRGDTLAEGWRIADDGRIAAEAENAKLRAALEHEVKRGRRHLAASTLAALQETKP